MIYKKTHYKQNLRNPAWGRKFKRSPTQKSKFWLRLMFPYDPIVFWENVVMYSWVQRLFDPLECRLTPSLLINFIFTGTAWVCVRLCLCVCHGIRVEMRGDSQESMIQVHYVGSRDWTEVMPGGETLPTECLSRLLSLGTHPYPLSYLII